MEVNPLLKDLIESCGLPDDLIFREILRMIEQSGLEPESIDLAQLRRLMVDYLQEVLPRAKDSIPS